MLDQLESLPVRAVFRPRELLEIGAPLQTYPTSIPSQSVSVHRLASCFRGVVKELMSQRHRTSP